MEQRDDITPAMIAVGAGLALSLLSAIIHLL